MFLPVLVFSTVFNLLMLTGPIFLLLVYERVIASRAEETLVVLVALVVFLYAVMAVLDDARLRIAARAGARFQARLDRAVLDATLRRGAVTRANIPPWRDLDAMRRLAASPAFLTLFDAPWTPIFIGVIFLFHPALGLVALAGALMLAAIALLTQSTTAGLQSDAAGRAHMADQFGLRLTALADTVRALGMRANVAAHWTAARGDALRLETTASERAGTFGAVARALRLFLQSAILACGAWLVLRDALTPGAMLAASILLGRALAPVDTAILQWGLLQRARAGWTRLSALLEADPEDQPRIALPCPRGGLEAREISVRPAGVARPVLRMVSFRLEPGGALGVIGAGGSGKSTLARALSGIAPVAGGRVSLDGVALARYDPEALGNAIGYLPQRVEFFDATVAENIARLHPGHDDAEVLRAAERAGVHDMITQLPDGYETRMTVDGGGLSGSQLQRIALARALYGAPALLILDDPTAGLDNDDCATVNAAIRAHKAAGGSALVTTHRPAVLQECETLMVLDAGIRRAYGPREQVLREQVHNQPEIAAVAASAS